MKGMWRFLYFWLLTPLVRWHYKSANPIFWRFQASSWIFQPMLPECSTNFMNLLYEFLQTNLTCGRPQFHNRGPLPLTTSWISQTNFINIFAQCLLHILTFSFHNIWLLVRASKHCLRTMSNYNWFGSDFVCPHTKTTPWYIFVRGAILLIRFCNDSMFQGPRVIL